METECSPDQDSGQNGRRTKTLVPSLCQRWSMTSSESCGTANTASVERWTNGPRSGSRFGGIRHCICIGRFSDNELNEVKVPLVVCRAETPASPRVRCCDAVSWGIRNQENAPRTTPTPKPRPKWIRNIRRKHSAQWYEKSYRFLNQKSHLAFYCFLLYQTGKRAMQNDITFV